MGWRKVAILGPRTFDSRQSTAAFEVLSGERRPTHNVRCAIRRCSCYRFSLSLRLAVLILVYTMAMARFQTESELVNEVLPGLGSAGLCMERRRSRAAAHQLSGHVLSVRVAIRTSGLSVECRISSVASREVLERRPSTVGCRTSYLPVIKPSTTNQLTHPSRCEKRRPPDLPGVP